MSAVRRPNLWVIAGPNGGGKTALTERFWRRGPSGQAMVIVNPDVIAQALRETHPDESEYRIRLMAGRRALEERSRRLSAGQSFTIETTLAGQSELRFMRMAAKMGFRVNLFYMGLPSPEASMLRVGTRFLRGGHDIPAGDVFRRFSKSLEHLPLAMKLADRVRIYDNGGRKRELVYLRNGARPPQMHKHPPEWLTTALNRPFLGVKG